MGDEKRRDRKGRLLYMGETQDKDGKYWFRYTDRAGKRKAITSWCLTKSDPTPVGKKPTRSLRELEKDIRMELDRGICDEGLTVAELVDRYVLTRTNVTKNTRAGYKTVQNILKVDDFGKKRIKNVRYSDALIFLQKLQKGGRSYSTVSSIRGVLKPAFELAKRDEMIWINPFDFELKSALIDDRIKRESITHDQERKFLKFVKEDPHFCRYYDGIFILFKTGIRISEFCGLRISDIDFENRRFTIDHQLQRERNGNLYVINTAAKKATAKTPAGTRTLPMSDEVYDTFKRIVANRPKVKVEPYVDGYYGFLFLNVNHNTKGIRPCVAMDWEHYFKRILNKYNSIYKVQMPLVTPHICRHTYCTRMITEVSPKTLQYLMGHASIETTMDIYADYGYEDVLTDFDEAEAIKALKQATRDNNRVTEKRQILRPAKQG